MTNPNDPAYPMLDKSGIADGVTHYAYVPHSSLTNRELFAAMAMQGLCAANRWNSSDAVEQYITAQYAVEQADALIEALYRPTEMT